MWNRIYGDVEEQRRVITVGSNVAPGTPLIRQGTPYVTITGSGDHTNGLTSTGNAVIDLALGVGEGNGGIGLLPTQATVSPTGTYSFPVEGSSVTAAYETDGSGKLVYITSAGALTLTATGNTLYGRVEFFRGEDGPTDTAVKIGATN